MSIIRPVDMNGMISRSQDVTTMKQNENNKGMIDQNNFHQEFKKEIQHHMKKVNDPEKGQGEEYKYGDKKEGSQGSHSQNNRQKKKDNNQSDQKEKVMIKGSSSFDIKI